MPIARAVALISLATALLHGKRPRQISFTSTCQMVLASWMLLCRALEPAELADCISGALEQLAGCEVANRLEPRVLKRRRHAYKLILKPRDVLKAELLKNPLKNTILFSTVPFGAGSVYTATWWSASSTHTAWPIERKGMSLSQPQRFFVLHLANDWPEKSADVKYEIQIVNESGQAISWGYAGDHETEIVINGCRIPKAVLEAARRQLMGKGDYVDYNGCSISPVDL